MLSGLLGLSGAATALGGKLFEWLQARAQSQQNTAVEGIKAAAQQTHDEFAWPEMRWVIALTILAFNVHLWAFVLDRTFHLGWAVEQLPDPVGSWEGTVLLAPFAAAGVLGVVKRVIGK